MARHDTHPSASLSLLWPAGSHRQPGDATLGVQCVRDLELDQTLAALTQGASGQKQLGEILYHLCSDPAVIRYRQDLLEDVWCNPSFGDHLDALIPTLHSLAAYRGSVDRRRSLLQDVAWRLGELENLVQCVDGLHDAFDRIGDALQAAGWLALRHHVTQTAREAVYQNLRRELPALVHAVRSKASVTIGVNLDSRLRPVAATLLSVNADPFTGSTLIDRLFGRHGDTLKGIGPLHSVPKLDQGEASPRHGAHDRDVNPLMVPLFHDLARVLDTVCRPIARALRQYVALQSGFWATLGRDMAFYLAAIRLMKRLHGRGLPLCRPQLVPMTERVCELRQAYNINLALQLLDRKKVDDLVVKNDVALSDAGGRIAILTGPNQGGKTTYTQLVGLCQVLAQAGLWVPAVQARMSPVDGIYTHYPAEETLATATGRFGDEARRLSDLFAHATRYSLLLFNESLSSTSSGESLYIAQDLVRILRRMGTRAVFTTHLHELAASVEQLNAATEGDSRIVSLVASRIESEASAMQRSYKIAPGPPIGHSYAREIASKYGIGYEQLTARLQERGVLDVQPEEDRRIKDNAP